MKIIKCYDAKNKEEDGYNKFIADIDCDEIPKENDYIIINKMSYQVDYRMFYCNEENTCYLVNLYLKAIK